MAEMWKRLGFKENPYNIQPLSATEEDADLFTGRKDESAEFLTLMDTTHGGVVIVSGEPGVGKTSFINVQQYLLSTELAGLTPKLLPTESPILEPSKGLVVVNKNDDDISLARKVVQKAVCNVIAYCNDKNIKDVPEQIEKLSDYLSLEPNETGFDFSFSIFDVSANTSQTVTLLPPAEATLDNWKDALAVISNNCVKHLDVNGIIACLDNAEELELRELGQLMMSCRDTLFATPNVWWVIIGPSGLSGRLSAIDTRVSERIHGGVEIPPMTSEELHKLVELRIKKFGPNDEAVSPLSEAIHKQLFAASRGVARFVLRAADAIINGLVADVRKNVSNMPRIRRVSPEYVEKRLNKALSEILFENQVPNEAAIAKLSELSSRELADLQLSEELLLILGKIKNERVSPEDHREFGFKSTKKFKERFLDILANEGVLKRQTSRGKDIYWLYNYSFLCSRLDAFEKVSALMREKEKRLGMI